MASNPNFSSAVKKESIDRNAVQQMGKASASEISIPTMINGRLVATTDLNEPKSPENADQEKATDDNECLNINGKCNEIHGCEGPVQPPANAGISTCSSSKQAEGNDPEEQKYPLRRQTFKSSDQLKSWKDLRGCDEPQGTRVTIPLVTINESVELPSECTNATPLLAPIYHGSDLRSSQGSRAVLSQLLTTPRPDTSVLLTAPSNKSATRAPEWRQRARSVMLPTGAESARGNSESTQLTLMAGPSDAEFMSHAIDTGVTNLGHRPGAPPAPNRLLLNRAVGTPVRKTESWIYAPAQNRPLPVAPPSEVKNGNSRQLGSGSAYDGISSIWDRPPTIRNPTPLTSNEDFTQPVPKTPILRPMELVSPEPSPFPTFPEDEFTQSFTETPSVDPTIRVANDLSPLFDTPQPDDYELTGYHRTDPSVTWVSPHSPSAVAPPEHRHSATQLPRDGFLSPSLLRQLPPASISFVTPTTPATLPAPLHAYLAAKRERLERHAAGDAWRRQHAHAVVRRHEESVFQKRAQDGDWGLKGWHMSAEYHGQPPARGGGNGHGNGHGNGNGGQGRGDGGAGYRGGFGGRGRGGGYDRGRGRGGMGRMP